jgi:hypothetical protein
LGAVNAHTVRTENPDPLPAGDFHQFRFQLYSLFLTGLTKARCTEVNCSYPFFGTFFHKLGSNLGINQADYIVDVARDIFETGINLMTFDLPSLGINEIEGAVEFNFEKAFQESARPVPSLGSCDANKGDRIRVEEEVQVMLMRILHTPYSVILR